MTVGAIRFGDDHLSELSGGHAGAVIRRAVKHHADSDPLIHLDEDQAMRPLDRQVSMVVLGEGRRPHHVVDVDRYSEMLPQIRPERDLLPSGITAALDNTGAGIDKASRAHADTDDLTFLVGGAVGFGVFRDRSHGLVGV